jgi:hypothetical protein
VVANINILIIIFIISHPLLHPLNISTPTPNIQTTTRFSPRITNTTTPLIRIPNPKTLNTTSLR